MISTAHLSKVKNRHSADAQSPSRAGFHSRQDSAATRGISTRKALALHASCPPPAAVRGATEMARRYELALDLILRQPCSRFGATPGAEMFPSALVGRLAAPPSRIYLAHLVSQAGSRRWESGSGHEDWRFVRLLRRSRARRVALVSGALITKLQPFVVRYRPVSLQEWWWKHMSGGRPLQALRPTLLDDEPL
jgi:hypothetical protein